MIDPMHSFEIMETTGHLRPIRDEYRAQLAAGYDTAEGSRLIAERVEQRRYEHQWLAFRLRLIVLTGVAMVTVLIGIVNA